MEELPERNASQPEPEDRPAEAGEESAAVAESTPAEALEAASVEPEGEPEVAQPEAAARETTEAPEETVERVPTPAEAVEPAETPAAGDTPEPVETPGVVAATESVESAQTVEALTAETTPEAEAVKAKEKAAAPVPPAKPAGPRLTDLKAGMVMDGIVTRIERYGAFVNLGLAERRDGLIHISELASYRVNRVEDVVKVGDQVRARVVSVDLAKGRIGLSLNDLPTESYAEADTGSSEPALTPMQLAFERAYGRRREDGKQAQRARTREDLGTRRKREHEELMRKLRSGS